MSERALRGVSAAPGVAVGPAVVLDRMGAPAARMVPAAERPKEVERAQRALEAVAREMDQIASHLRRAGRMAEADIVEASALMAADPGLETRVDELIMQSGRSAADALREAAEENASALAQLADPMLAERADDVLSLGRRASARAIGVGPGSVTGVLVASSLGPADIAEMATNAKGVALAGGGVTAHAAIVARSLGVPMIVGLGPGVLEIEDGEEVVLDGDAGSLYRHPDSARVAAATAEADRLRDARMEAIAQRSDPAQTRDGRLLRVLANAASVAEVIEATEQGAEGVGLLRTELLHLDAQGWPTQAQQASFVGLVLAPLAGRIATVRLLDFGGDKTPPFLRGATGRGIELLLQNPEALRAQLSAIVTAGAKTRLRILIPMVTSHEQVAAVRRMLATVLGGRPAPEVGAMIETPDAAHHADEIAKVCDFVSIGTNDLTQLVLGLDRERSKSAPVTDIRVLRLISGTMHAARSAGIPVDVCGEAASDAAALPLLVGLGVDEVSVAAARVGEVRKWIRELDFAACREEARKLLLDEPADAAPERG